MAVITGNMELAHAPGNVLLPARSTGLPRDSVVNVSQLLTLDRTFLTELTPVNKWAVYPLAFRISSTRILEPFIPSRCCALV